MKHIILIVVGVLLIVSDAKAQFRHIHDRAQRSRSKGPPSALKVIGISSIPTGCFAATCGLFLYGVEGDTGGRGSNNNSTPSRDYSGLILAGAGGALVIGGITMLIIDASHHRADKWSVIAPKRNEIGFARNF